MELWIRILQACADWNTLNNRHKSITRPVIVYGWWVNRQTPWEGLK